MKLVENWGIFVPVDKAIHRCEVIVKPGFQVSNLLNASYILKLKAFGRSLITLTSHCGFYLVIKNNFQDLEWPTICFIRAQKEGAGTKDEYVWSPRS